MLVLGSFRAQLACVDNSISEDSDEPDKSDDVSVLGARGLSPPKSLLHDDNVLLPIEDQSSEVGGDEGVDTARGAGQEDVRIGGAGAERAGNDAEHVDEANAKRPVTQLKGEADKQLHQHVEQDVLDS
jgi:hypothetical protein